MINKFEKLPLKDIKPLGWMNTFFERQIKGITGNPDIIGYPFDTSMWVGETLPRHESHINNQWWCNWWPYEQASYFLDGANRVAIIMGDEKLRELVKANMDFMMNNTREDGRIGTDLSGEYWRWPYANINRVFMTHHELDGDMKYVEFLHKHYLSFEGKDFQDDLELANVEQLIWLYDKTNDKKMLEMAEEAYKLFNEKYENRDRNGNDIDFFSDKIPDTHGVVYIELLKIPALLYSATGKKEYWDEAMNALNKMEDSFMLVSGLPSTTEHFMKRTDLAGHETCNTATFPYTYGYFYRISGDSSYGDKIERALFNASMGSFTKDFKAHQYFSAPNQAISTFSSCRFAYYNGFDCYVPAQKVECCTGNLSRMMPYYLEQMYLKSKDNDIVLALFGPSTLKTTLNGEKVEIVQDTNYPFEESIKLTIKSESKNLPLMLRVPEWCEKASIKVDGKNADFTLEDGFAKLDLTINSIAVVDVKFDMQIKFTNQVNGGVTAERGPLVYVLPIKEEKKIVRGYPKSSNTFPAIERRAGSEWRYAINMDLIEAEDYGLIETNAEGYPWDIDSVPTKIKVPVQKVLNWDYYEYFDTALTTVVTTTPKIPENILSDNSLEYIEFVPYGATQLRMAILPKITNSSERIKEESTTLEVVY